MLIVVKIVPDFCFIFMNLVFLVLSRFLIETKGPELSRKVREAISCNLALVRSKSDVMGPSYDRKTVLKNILSGRYRDYRRRISDVG